MTYCKKCNVELDELMASCPLCGTSVQGYDQTEETTGQFEKALDDKSTLTHYARLTRPQKRKLFWELSAIILFSCMITSILIDLIIHKHITWSKYVLMLGIALFINISLIVFWFRKILLLFSFSFVSLSFLLRILDGFKNPVSWITKLGIPILLAMYVILFCLILIIKKSKSKGVNLIAYTFLAIGLFSMFIEGIIAVSKQEEVVLQWSIILCVSIIPVVAILFYIHYRLGKGTDLKRFFHI